MGARWRVQQATADSRTKQNEFIAIFGLVDRLPKMYRSPAKRDAEIRERYANGALQKELAADYGLGMHRIHLICKGVQRKVYPKNTPAPEKRIRNKEICERFSNGETLEQLGEAYGLSVGYIRRRICNFSGSYVKRQADQMQRKAEIAERNEEIRERYANGETQTKIAADVGICQRTISDICKGVENQLRPRLAPSEIQARNAEIREGYARGELPKVLAADYGLTPSFIYIICKGVERKPVPKREPPETRLRNAEIRERYANGETQRKLTADYGIARSTLGLICKGVERKANPKVQRNAEIRERYANGELQKKLAADYGLTQPSIYLICRGVERKSKPPRGRLPSPEIQARNEEIRERYANGEIVAKLAQDYGISRQRISKLCKGVERKQRLPS